MGVRQFLKQSQTLVSAVRDARRLLASARAIERWGPNSRARRYLASARPKKLQIGAGASSLQGWLRTDISPISSETMYLDATKRFPFDDSTFDYIHTEHMIEHISWQDALRMLKECRRILKSTGTLRVATPDLAVMLDLYNRRDSLAERYVAYIADVAGQGFLADIPIRHHPVFVINTVFYDWGHRFLYDAETLMATMRLAGFTSMRGCASGQSDDPHLAGLEFHGRGAEQLGVDMREVAEFETMVVEAR